MYYPSGYFKAKAREALKGYWQTALLIALIVNLPSLLAQGISVFTGNDPADRLQAIIVTASRDGTLTQSLLTREITAFLNSSGFWLTVGLNAAAWLVTPCLALGMYKWLMDRLRKAPDTDAVTGALCRVRLFLKAVGLQLLIILKVLLWMLPGLAVFIGMTFLLYRAGTAAAAQSVNALALPAVLLMAVPGAVAALRYAMAEFILADDPAVKVTECVRRSKEQMRDQKKMLFMLLFSFLIWYLLQLLVSSYLSGMGAGIVSLLFQMATGLALSVYMSGSEAAFYLETRLGQIPKREEKEEIRQ